MRCFLFLLALAALHPPLARGAMEYLDDGLIKVGVDLDRGGAIGFLADDADGQSVVNVHDLGRWIGQSYYAGPKPFGVAHPGWVGWPWNPVSAGDVYGNPSKLLEKKNDGQSLYVRSTPMQWALKNVPGDCQFETWITLVGRTVHVRNRLTNQRADRTQYPAMDQELPFVYTIGKLHRLMTYTGDAPFTDAPLQEIPQRVPKNGRVQWSAFFATEHWAALVDDRDWGLGVIHPGVVRFLGGFHGAAGAGGPEDDPTGYIAPVRREILDCNIVYEFHYTLVLDTLANIRAQARAERPASERPDYHFASDRQHWWLRNAEDSGYPIEARWRVKVEQNDPQLYGPEGCWEARDVPRIYVRAAYQTRNRHAELFWETAEKPGFAAGQSVRFEIVPDGKMRTYSVDLSTSPSYRGVIRALRFDPVDTGQAGETVEIESITASEPRSP